MPGVSGGIGAQRVKVVEPDGYVLLQAASPHTTNAAVKPQANVDMLRDFVPIGQTGLSVYTLCASKESGIASLADMIVQRPRPSPMSSRSAASASARPITSSPRC